MTVKIKVDFDSSKVFRRDHKRFKNSQKKLISQIIKDTTPYVPMQDGILYQSAIVNQNRYKDKIVWTGPYARFLYHGKVMVGVRSRSAWAKRGEVKETTDRALHYSKRHPQAGSKWYVRSKARNKQKWINFAKKVFKND